MRVETEHAIAQATPTGWTVELIDPASTSTSSLVDICAAVAGNGGGRVEFWVEDVDDDEWVRASGLEPYRDLLVLRVDLPIDAPIIDTRAYTDDDAAAFLEVNNRAFAWHPEQADMSPTDLASRQSEPWFDPDGFRLLELDGRLAGFCWTKIHADQDPPEGEIYVIGVDPDYHGRGLGMPLTAAGLDWLSNAGLTIGILYVESDNHPAIRTYEKLGFARHRVNRAFQRDVEPA